MSFSEILYIVINTIKHGYRCVIGLLSPLYIPVVIVTSIYGGAVDKPLYI